MTKQSIASKLDNQRRKFHNPVQSITSFTQYNMIDEADPKVLWYTTDGHLIEKDGPFTIDLTCVDDYFNLPHRASLENRALKAFADYHDINEEEAHKRLHATPGAKVFFGE